MKIVLSFFVFFNCFGCSKQELIKPSGIEILKKSDNIVFAVIGDYGYDGTPEKEVADMVLSWNPDFILTTGDNNYPLGQTSTLNNNIGKHYADYIYNFDAPKEYYCNGTANFERTNRFFPTPGNHDAAGSSGLTPYLNYFTLPGNELFYHFVWGPVSFYALNSTNNNMDEQFNWLTEELKTDSLTYRLVYFHHSPYSPGPHGNEAKMQWDYSGHGINAVLTGHDHIYARIEAKEQADFHYLITGAGGKSLYSADKNKLDTTMFTVVTYDQNYGAIKAVATPDQLTFQYFSIDNQQTPIDAVTILSK